MRLDIAAFGPHPDDVEIGIGGTLIKHARLGYACGIIDLTAGEMSTNGTPAERRDEALAAADIMGIKVRENLGLPDGRLRDCEENLLPIIESIRRYRPRIVFAPYREDRHPDHSNTGLLVQQAVYLSGLRKYPADGEPYRPSFFANYFLAKVVEPSFIIDISDVYEQKVLALKAHKSQFGSPVEGGYRTMVNDPYFLRLIKSRDQYTGAKINALWGEGVFTQQHLVIDDMMMLRGTTPRHMVEKR